MPVLRNWLDFSARGRARVYTLTLVGTLLCIAVSFTYDSYSWETGHWRLGARPLNNVIIPVILGLPFFFILLSKMRALAIAQHELIMLASTDQLTNCLNRRAFNAVVEAYLAKAQKHGQHADGALLIADIDHFKRINDRYGHDRGDEALKMVAAAIREGVRMPELVARIGGEEFGIFIPGAEAANPVDIGERIRTNVQHLDFRPGGQKCPITVSIGGARFDGDTSFVQLYHVADRHLYSAKRAGRNRVDIAVLPEDGEPVGPVGPAECRRHTDRRWRRSA